ncbi:BZIP domain-containing protein [Fusarium sp. LHS14.1]|nr:BZIP domain-containing protein [Fusarium sp. LHS14.1]
MDPIPNLVPLSTRPDIWQPDDDWTGVTNQTKRKKLQNRISQRAYRRRKRQQAGQPSSSFSAVHHPRSDIGNSDNELQTQQMTLTGQYGTDDKIAGLFQGCALLTCPHRISQITCLIRQAYEDYSLQAPRPAYLPVLIRLNVLNALARNAISMGFPPEGLCRDEAISPYNANGPQLSNNPQPATSCPPALQPTSFQAAVVHHPWIDLLPFPQLRDNMLTYMEAGLVDDEELCEDLLMVDDPRGLDRPEKLLASITDQMYTDF